MKLATLLICSGLLSFAALAAGQQTDDVSNAVRILKKAKVWDLTGGFLYGPSDELLATRVIAKSPLAERHFLGILKTGSDVGRLFGALGLRFIRSKKLEDPSVTAGIKGKEVQALHGCIMDREKDTEILRQIKSGKLDELETQPKEPAKS